MVLEVGEGGLSPCTYLTQDIIFLTSIREIENITISCGIFAVINLTN